MGDFPVIILDFETSGLGPGFGDRPIEIGAVRIERQRITNHFQNLMNPGFRISPFIESYTGITNSMVSKAPACEEVMERFAEFMGDTPLVAHNASFDEKFLDMELARIGKRKTNPMACTMLTARRIYPEAANHKLGTLVEYCGIETVGTFHRALDDATMAGYLWIAMIQELKDSFGIDTVSFELMHRLSRTSKAKVRSFLKGWSKRLDETGGSK